MDKICTTEAGGQPGEASRSKPGEASRSAHPGWQSTPALLPSLSIAAPAACGGCVEDFGQQERVLQG